MKRRQLSEEEERLWQHVTRNDAPLSADDKRRLPETEKKQHAAPARAHREAWPVFTQAASALPDLSRGAYAGIDRNTAERFRKGHYPLDGTLDLHGMSREKAHIALGNFLHSHYGRGSRCVLVVTGKGKKQQLQYEAAQDIFHGVLREMLPQWLGEPGLRPMVLAFDVASSKHGGSGAYYILLRRKRG